MAATFLILMATLSIIGIIDAFINPHKNSSPVKDEKIDSLKQDNININVKIDSINNEKYNEINKIKQLDNDSTVKLFYKLIRE